MEMTMKVENVMTRNVRIADANMTIGEAAKLMAEIDAGTLPVSDQGRLVGMLTDRDIAVRAVAQGLNSDTPVRQVMTKEISCRSEEHTSELQSLMRNSYAVFCFEKKITKETKK